MVSVRLDDNFVVANEDGDGKPWEPPTEQMRIPHVAITRAEPRLSRWRRLRGQVKVAASYAALSRRELLRSARS